MKKVYPKIFIICLGLLLGGSALGQQKIPNIKNSQRAGNSPSAKPDSYRNTKFKLNKVAAVKGKSVGVRNFIQNTQNHQSLSKRLSLANQDHKITLRNSKYGYPAFISSVPGIATRGVELKKESALDAARIYLKELQGILPQRNPVDEFSLKSFDKDELGHAHLKFQQTFKGIPVFAQEIIIHFQDDGKRILNGSYSKTPQIPSLEPILEVNEARQIAFADLKERTKVRSLTPYEHKMLKMGHRKNWELVIYPLNDEKDSHKLAYRLEFHPNFIEHWSYFIDAENGDILNQYNETCSIVPPITKTETHLNGNTYTMGTFREGDTFVLLDASKSMFKGNSNTFPQGGQGIIVTLDLQDQPLDSISDNELFLSSDNNFSPEATSAHLNSIISYDYYEQTFGRQSINGRGNDVVSFVNVTEEDGSGLDNAFWNGFYMFYGNGDFAFEPLMGGLDVGGHEITHGVIQETANLIYQNQPGALNESFADVFGFLIEGEEDFRIGEDIARGNVFRSGALRDMLNPNNGGSSLRDNGYQPSTFTERFTGTEDNGGVHINSGIPNRAFALFYQAVGKTKAEQVYYRALTRYLTRTSQFLDCRQAIIQASQELYGSAEATAAGNAFDAVGIRAPEEGGEETQGTVSFPVIDLPQNPGDEFITLTDVDTTAVFPVLSYNFEKERLIPLSRFRNIQPLSISDDGTTAVFVDKNNEAHFVRDVNTGNPTDFYLFGQGFDVWTNAAISKDGEKVALVTGDRGQDSSIYVLDLNKWFGNLPLSQSIKKFKLFNNTTAEGVSTSGIWYADAITWDHSSQFVMYDAFNVAETPTGRYGFFDVGLIEVWDNNSDDFGSGDIISLFNLDRGESIGNPVFSHNSNYQITFDLEIEPQSILEDYEYHIIASNLESGDIKFIVENNGLGFPNYSLDDRAILYTKVENNSQAIKFVSLAEDKITPVTLERNFLEGFKWGIWYADGIRSLTTPVEPILLGENKLEIFPNPFTNTVHIKMEMDKNLDLKLKLINTLGQELSNKVFQASQGMFETTLDLSDLPEGIYWLNIESEEGLESMKLVKRR